MGKRYVGAIPSFDWDEMLEGNELLRRIIFESQFIDDEVQRT